MAALRLPAVSEHGAGPMCGEPPAVRRGGPGVATRRRAPRTGADESTWTTRKTRSSGPLEDRARGDQGIIGWTRSAHSSDDGGSRVIIRWAWSAHSLGWWRRYKDTYNGHRGSPQAES